MVGCVYLVLGVKGLGNKDKFGRDRYLRVVMGGC